MQSLNGNKSKKIQKRLAEMYGTQEVFVIPSGLMNSIPNLFIPKKIAEKKKLQVPCEQGKFILRSDAEYDLSFQQIIPCALIKDSYQEYFVIKRLKGNNESRLNGKYSLLIGGHIIPQDGYKHNIDKCIVRELRAATTIRSIPYYANQFYGYVQDQTSDLADHLGIVHHVTITNCYKDKLEVKRPTENEGIWMSKSDLQKYYQEFDSWNRLIISFLLFGTKEEVYRWKEISKAAEANH